MFEEAKKLIPGGVNSPVRAFKSVGGTPIFIKKAKGAYLFDEDDKIKIINKWVKKFKSRSPLASQMIKRSINVLAFHDALAIMHMDYDQFLLTQNYSDS